MDGIGRNRRVNNGSDSDRSVRSNRSNRSNRSDRSSARGVKFEMFILDKKFDDFIKTSDNMSSYLNTRATKKRFEEFHLKMKIWKEREKYRKRQHDRYKKTSAKIVANLEYARDESFVESNEIITQVYADYSDF